jgi:hypothetical protein
MYHINPHPIYLSPILILYISSSLTTQDLRWILSLFSPVQSQKVRGYMQEYDLEHQICSKIFPEISTDPHWDYTN